MLIILHGWGQSCKDWTHFIDKFEVKDIVCINMPGFGDEKLISAEWGVSDYSSWVENKIERKRYKNVVLLGHSFGGRVAVEIASKNPSWLRKLILVDAPIIRLPSMKIKIKIRIFKTMKHFMPRSILSLFYHSEDKEAHSSGMGDIYRKVVSHDQAKILSKMKKPVLIIWGENDQEVPLLVGEEIHSNIIDSDFVVLPDSGHNPHLDSVNLLYSKVAPHV